MRQAPRRIPGPPGFRSLRPFPAPKEPPEGAGLRSRGTPPALLPGRQGMPSPKGRQDGNLKHSFSAASVLAWQGGPILGFQRAFSFRHPSPSMTRAQLKSVILRTVHP